MIKNGKIEVEVRKKESTHRNQKEFMQKQVDCRNQRKWSEEQSKPKQKIVGCRLIGGLLLYTSTSMNHKRRVETDSTTEVGDH